MPVFRHRSVLPHSAEDVYRWHARPGAFERLLPPWESVRVLERTGGLEEGTRLLLRIRRGPLRFRWEVRHAGVDPGRGFTDEQIRGPFRHWRHAHRFVPDGDDRCRVEDEVDWEPPLGEVGRAFGRRLVEKELERLFRFRHERLANDLGRLRDSGTERALTVAVTGASGLVGSMLGAFLRAGGHRVISLVRSRAEAGEDGVYWSVVDGEIDAEGLEGVDAVVHLAGEPLLGLRWTGAKKRAILESREAGTTLLCRALAGLADPPRVLVSSSGVHYYGDTGNQIVTEESPPGEGFLAMVCRRWEDATEPARSAGIRVVNLRTALVLSPAGGGLAAMLPAFRAGVGGRLGGGRQYLAWIDPDDAVGLIHHALTSDALEGPVNAAAPHPVTNATFTDALGRVLSRPTLVPLPGAAVTVIFGQMGEETLLQGQRAVPRKALDDGYVFRYPGVEGSLRFQLGRSG
ncbi:MAG TPA: TIGR01777 family oxidoreductase [Longimicrobiales bacterium]|nr:TIGR01777 family oxidoreductase [Longimicrobiales bacterium]